MAFYLQKWWMSSLSSSFVQYFTTTWCSINTGSIFSSVSINYWQLWKLVSLADNNVGNRTEWLINAMSHRIFLTC